MPCKNSYSLDNITDDVFCGPTPTPPRISKGFDPRAPPFVPRVKQVALPKAAPAAGVRTGIFSRETVDGHMIQVKHPLDLAKFERAIGAHPDVKTRDFILSTIRDGADIGMVTDRGGSKGWACKNSGSLNQEYGRLIREEVQKDVTAGSKLGPFRNPPFSDFRCSPVAAVPKGPSEIRLIHNLSAPKGRSINDGIPDEFAATDYDRFDSAVDMVRKVGRGAWMAKVDLKAAFKHILVRPDQWHLLGLHLDSPEGEREFFFDTTLPFGLRSSPKLFNEFTKIIRWLARQIGIDNIYGYLDDFFIVDDTEYGCLEKKELFKSYMSSLGWVFNEEKDKGPAQIMELLGIEIDAWEQTLRITEKRMSTSILMLEEWRGRESATRREIASLVGKLQFLALACRPGRAFLRRAIDSLRGAESWDTKISLDSGILWDIHWWRMFLPQWNGVSLFSREEWESSFDIELSTDACNYGFGACYGDKWLYGDFEDWMYRQSMPFKEFYAIVAAVATWGHLWRGRKIKFLTDSWTVYQCIGLRRARTPAMAALFRTLFWYSAKFDCFIGAAHIKGIENGAADAVSRADFQRFFSIRPSAELSPSSIPSVLNSAFLSELSSSQAGRDCRQTGSHFSSPEDSQFLQQSICRIFEDDDVVRKANIPNIPWESPEDLVDGIRFGSTVCGRGAAFHRGGPTAEHGDQGYGSLGGVHSGSVRPGSSGAQQVDVFLGMAPPDNGVNYCDIDFGFRDELPTRSSLFVLPDIGDSEGSPAGFGCKPVILTGAPPVPEPGGMDLFDQNEFWENQWSDPEERGRVPCTGSRPARGRSDEPRKGDDLPPVAISSITGCGDGQVEWPTRPGRTNYRERTFYRRHGHEG